MLKRFWSNPKDSVQIGGDDNGPETAIAGVVESTAI